MGKIITIGREFGSGGREVGKRLSDELGIAYYDNEIITEIAKRTELAEGYVQHVMENGPTALMPITIGRTFYMGADPVMEQNNAIYREQSLLVQELAEKSDCVIVGRSADYILRDKKPLRLFIYADMESRMERCRHLEAPSVGRRLLAGDEIGQRHQSLRKLSEYEEVQRHPPLHLSRRRRRMEQRRFETGMIRNTLKTPSATGPSVDMRKKS